MKTDISHQKSYITPANMMWIILVAASLLSGILLVFYPISYQFIIAIIFGIAAILTILKYPFAGLLIYLAVFIIRPGELYPALAPLHLERILGVIVLVVSLLNQRRLKNKIYFPQDSTTKLFFLFLIVMVCSVFVSYDTQLTTDRIIDYLKLGILFTIIVIEVSNKKRFNIFITVWILLVAFNTFLAFRDYYGGGAIFRMGISRAVGRTSTLGDANKMATSLVATLPFIYAYMKIYKNQMIRLAGLAMLLLFLVMIVNTGSRSGILALLAAVGITIYFSRFKVIASIVALFCIVGAWFMMPEQYKERINTMTTIGDEEIDSNEVSSGRLDIWENGINIFLAHPILGVGAGAFRPACRSGNYGPSIDLQAHSLYVQLLATVGIVGFTVWFIFLGSLLLKYIRNRAPQSDDADQNEDNNWYRYINQAIFTTIGALLVSGIFGHSLFRYRWYLLAFISIIAAEIYNRRKSERLT